eukprot:g2873.t1
MAVGKTNKKAGRKGNKKKTVDPMTLKEWYDIKAPSIFQVRNPGKTLVTRTKGTKIASEGLKGRVFEFSLGDLNNDEDLGYRKVKLCCEDVQGTSVLTNFHGMDLTRDKLCSLIKKWQTLIEAQVDVRTTDGYLLRISCIGFTKKQENQIKQTCYAQASQIRAVRKKMCDIMSEEAGKCDLRELVQKFIPENISGEILKAVQSIYPMQNVYIRKVKALKKPKFDLIKLMEMHGDNTTEDVGMEMEREVEEGAEVVAADECFSSKASSDEPSADAAADSKAESGSSPAAESTPLNTLVSSEGASPSLLTGPRITSKKGYLERENMIRETQKAVREYYKEGMYQDALEVTQRLVDQVDDHFGRNHGVYGSALSDMALMMKAMGNHQEATEVYLKALEVYRTVYQGEENASFASTLHNLGMAFRAMAEDSKKLEKIPLMERAAESFERCVQIREKILTNNHPDLQLARSRLATVQGLLGGEKERTEARLRAALDGLQMAVGNDDASTANAMTNLALFLKGDGQHAEATELYTTVLAIRKKLYGPKHFDVLVSMHNLSMAHHAAGREDEAVKLQEEIARIGEEMGMTTEEQNEMSAAADKSAPDAGTLESTGTGTAPGKKTKGGDGGEDGVSGTTWKPMHARSRRKGKRNVTPPVVGLASSQCTAMPPMASRLVSAALLAILGLALASQTAGIDSSAAATTRTDDNPRPNVLVVVVDDLGWKDVGFHEPTFSTPNLDAMVAEGVELSTFYTAPTCTPSRAQLMTGRYSYRMGMQDSVLHSTEPRGVPLTETFVGEKLQLAGYGTAAVGKWHLGMHMPQYLPVERGFDEYYGILTGGGGHYAHMSVSQEFTPRGPGGKARTFTGPNIVEGSELAAGKEDAGIHSTELYTKKAAEYVEAMSAKDNPWFLYLSYQAIHDPIETDDTWINGRSCESISAENSSIGENDDTNYENRKVACGMVAQIDNGLGALRGLLEGLGEWDNTVVMFFSDNGGLASHGSVNRPFRGGKGDYWEGGVHVPAFVSGGFVSAALKRNGVEPYRYGHLTHVTDIHSTVLRLGGYSGGGDGSDELDGFDLWDAMVETKAAVREAVVINLNSPNFASSGAVRWGKYKLIRNPEPMETVIYSRVQSKLMGEGLVVSEATLAEAVSTVHDQVHLSDPKMYLFDIEQNPSESIEEGCGAHRWLGPVESCANLYNIPAFRDVRKKLEGMMLKAERESAAPTLRWEDDGPLADPANFGGWVPWRDRDGDPLASYSGVLTGGEEAEVAARDADSPAATGVSLAGVGWGGEQGGTVENAITVTATYASGLAMFIAIIAVGSTFVAYRAAHRVL